MERKELQPLVGLAVTKALAEAGVVSSADHRRRLLRVLFRCAARCALDDGVPAPIFIALALEGFGRELTTAHPATLLLPSTPIEELN
ncbi:hypothetical protein JYT28_00705 [Desulfobulbus sp. AH-315-M07]|nr:hypothetical protein [Desulfobulbus sp. AH-315-M07]